VGKRGEVACCGPIILSWGVQQSVHGSIISAATFIKRQKKLAKTLEKSKGALKSSHADELCIVSISNIHTYMHAYIHTYIWGRRHRGWRTDWSPLRIHDGRCCCLFYMTVWCLTLIGKPLGKSTKGKAKAWSAPTNSQWKFRTKWWMKTAISSFANSDPAQSRGPPPNGMKWLLLAAAAAALEQVEDPRALLCCCHHHW